MIVEAKTKKWTWAGHVARRQNNRWSIRVTNWTPEEGKRTRGKQKFKWADEVKKFAGMNWQQKAQDRVNWRNMGEVFVLQ